MKLFGPLLMVLGFILIAGTAGAWDVDITMSITQFLVQTFAGVVLMGIGAYHLR